MSKLYIVATPIGNLGDITLRALEILKQVDLILCEDTRVTQKLLNHYEIKTKTLSYHEHSGKLKEDKVLAKLDEGNTLALVTDAGTPGISDPGNKLVSLVIDNEHQVEVIPGVSALTALISVAGFNLDKFLFLGFLPHKKGRATLLREINQSKVPVILYESVYRINKLLTALDQARYIVIGRELTKKFETIYRGKVSEVITQLNNDKVKGEFVVIIK